MDGCSRIGGVRLAAPVRTLVAKNCKALAAVWIEDPPPPEEDEEEEGRGRGGRAGKNQSIRWTFVTAPRWSGSWGCEPRRRRGRLTVDLRGARPCRRARAADASVRVE